MNLPHNLPIDSKVQRLKRRYQGLSRVAAAINDLYIYGVYPSNFPNLTVVLEQAKDHCKEIIKETKAEIAFIENPNGMYDLVMDEVLDDADKETAKKIDSEVKKIVDKGYERAKKVLTEKIDDLHKLAKALLIYETLSGDEIRDLILKNIKPTRSFKDEKEADGKESSALGSLGLKPKPAV